jgi:hypothetical protein
MWCSFSDSQVRNSSLPNLLVAVAYLPALSMSKNGRNLVHGIRPGCADAFSQATFSAAVHIGLCAAVVIFVAAIVGDPFSSKRKFSIFLVSTSSVGVGCIGVGGRA